MALEPNDARKSHPGWDVQSGASIIAAAAAALIVATATALIIIAVAILWDRDILLCRWYSYLYFFRIMCIYIYVKSIPTSSIPLP
jgi:hypothetical protein